MILGKIIAVTDTALVRQLRDQDEDALINLYRRHGALVYAIALKTLGNEQDAEEVTQDVFLQIWRKSNQFDPSRGKFLAWLTTTARNAAIDRLRKRQRREPDQAPISLDESPQLWEVLGADNDEHDIRGHDLRRSIAGAVQRLPLEQREAILLAYFHGLTQSEIAHRLERPLGTVKSHIRQGMERLRQIWLSEE